MIAENSLCYAVAYAQPASNDPDIVSAMMLTKFVLPHVIDDMISASIESRQCLAEKRIEVKSDVCRKTIDANAISETDVSDKYQNVIERIAHLLTDMRGCIEKLVVSKKKREGKAELVKNSKGSFDSLRVCRTQLCSVSLSILLVGL